MQNNQNLWIGLLVGGGLTGLLVYVLSQQADSFNTAPAKKTPVITTPFVQAEPPEPSQTKVTRPAAAAQKVIQPPVKASTTTQQPSQQAIPKAQTQKSIEPQNIDLPGLPENPRLPEKELVKLSPEEREKYDEVLTSYQQVRNKVLKLHQEREQLKQQMDKVIEENTTIDQQLDKLKKARENN